MHGRDRRTVAVVGGGLAGLSAAVAAADAGAAVTLFDARRELGGRARTHLADGFARNQGPHALYRAGAARAALRRWGVPVAGHLPSLRGGELAVEGELRRAARPSTLGHDGRLGLRRLLSPGAAGRADGRTMAEWLDDELPAGRARDAAAALVRLTSYGGDLDHADAAALITQVRRGLRGVVYLDGGWASLVDGLTDVAVGHGVRIVRGAKVTGVRVDGARRVIETTDGGADMFDAVVLANGGAEHAAALLDGASPTLDRWATTAHPVVAGCLDVALSRLPNRDHTNAVGLDEPSYCIVHSLTARLAPDDGVVVHVLRYGDDLADADELRMSLEAQLDRAQPGWRDVLVDARFGRRLTVAHDVPRPESAGRPDVVLPDLDGVLVAGDWITGDGLLADAAVSSGVRAGTLAATGRAPSHADRRPSATMVP